MFPLSAFGYSLCMLSRQATDEFKQLCKDEFGVDVSDEFAMEQGVNLLNLMNHVYQPVKQEWQDEFAAAIDTPDVA